MTFWIVAVIKCKLNKISHGSICMYVKEKINKLINSDVVKTIKPTIIYPFR